MLDLREHLNEHFRFMGGLDNLPILATPKPRKYGGRVQLAKVMADMGLLKAVEVGTRYGASAKMWMETIPDLDLTCIDPYRAYGRVSQRRQDQVYEGAIENAQTYGFVLYRCPSLDAVDEWEDDSLDWVNIDGDHRFDAAVRDIIQWAPKVRDGGLVLVHDYCCFSRSGVMPAVNGYTSSHMCDPWYVTRDKEPTAFWQRGCERAGMQSG